MLFVKRWGRKDFNAPDPALMTRHLYIAGTGRAGTSFLVKYLTALGMDTSLSRGLPHATWDESANAGLEESPDNVIGPDVPHVVKSPWLHLVVDDLLAQGTHRIDGLIVPIRDLAMAAKSRVSNERKAIARGNGWGARLLDDGLDLWGATPGGVTYTLNETDQMRLLAVGFHTLIERFIAADLPIVFLHFPRSVRDPDYLFRKLRPFLPGDITAARASAAFRELADETKVHFG